MPIPGQDPLSIADSGYGTDVDLDVLDGAGCGYRWIRLCQKVGSSATSS